MFRTHTSVAADSRPVLTDWTIRELLAWLAADDARGLDQTLLPLLGALDAALPGNPGEANRAPRTIPTSPAPLVRAIAARVRAEPALGGLRVRELALAVRRQASVIPS